MNEQEQMQSCVIEVVTRFENRSMAITPEAVTVNLSEPYLIVTLRGAICEAERRYAQERSSRELLEKLYTDVFDAAKSELEGAIADILRRRVQRSRITIDPMLGDAILTFVTEAVSGTKRTESSGTFQSHAK
ncbi:MAG: DUF2294 domain-containing protein [Planctomycetaceae bacterium]|nr:DUF2294 domain-containing protein [Planctomycetaceae bacterium]